MGGKFIIFVKNLEMVVKNQKCFIMKKFFYLLALCLSVLVFSSCSKDDDEGGISKTPVSVAVDLGLSVKWATCNVGANSPEECGDFFAWGETEPKETYNWNTYSDPYYTKYSTSGKSTLDLSDDAAHVNWGGNWRMPTKTEWDELHTGCTWTWTTDYEGTGVYGYIVKSKTNNNSIFLPAAGLRRGSDLYFAGSNGNYWSSSLYPSLSNYAYVLDFGSGYMNLNNYYRYDGQSVRPVSD